MNKLAILGASGHGKVLADMAELIGWQSVTFFDDAWPTVVHNGHWSVVGNTDALLQQLSSFDGVIVGIGNNAIRLDKQALLTAHCAPLISLIHPSAQISRYGYIGVGTAIMASATINLDCDIGAACIINTHASIDHDCQLADGVHISPAAALAGGVIIERGAWIGIGANVRQLITIGANALVGAGGVVVKPVLPNTCVAGNPAKILKQC
ncbi:acetyltransferase [Oceanisphaera pacifica]|uniref:Acetyltransferase n=1 Tax=Oceanisphaera pacifica TaxID=2818389 RepID=A0ABS3NGK8_9GAMM|nr:acetyltransferase [Oceanisphaera pacifica]MBO1519733.1 acetyltransferase [Oceanisphaera pacifica]